jgi:hypothetical protein
MQRFSQVARRDEVSVVEGVEQGLEELEAPVGSRWPPASVGGMIELGHPLDSRGWPMNVGGD